MLVKVGIALGLVLCCIYAQASIRVVTLYEVGEGNVVLAVHTIKITNQYIYSPYGTQKNLSHSAMLPSSPCGRGAGGEGVYQSLFNQTRKPLNIIHNQFGYTGQSADPSTSLMILGGFRNYAPGIGRFIQPDTYNSFSKQSITNPNAYVDGNSLSLSDPSGHVADPVIDFVRGLIDPKGFLNFLSNPGKALGDSMEALGQAIQAGRLPEALVGYLPIFPVGEESIVFDGAYTPEYTLLSAKVYAEQQLKQIGEMYGKIDATVDDRVKTEFLDKGKAHYAEVFKANPRYRLLEQKMSVFSAQFDSINKRYFEDYPTENSEFLSPGKARDPLGLRRARWYKLQFQNLSGVFKGLKISPIDRLLVTQEGQDLYDRVNKMIDATVNRLQLLSKTVEEFQVVWFNPIGISPSNSASRLSSVVSLRRSPPPSMNLGVEE